MTPREFTDLVKTEEGRNRYWLIKNNILHVGLQYDRLTRYEFFFVIHVVNKIAREAQTREDKHQAYMVKTLLCKELLAVHDHPCEIVKARKGPYKGTYSFKLDHQGFHLPGDVVAILKQDPVFNKALKRIVKETARKRSQPKSPE